MGKAFAGFRKPFGFPRLGRMQGGGGVAYSAEADALFARFTSDPGATRKGQVNTLIEALKTAGIWTKLDALWVMAAHDGQAAQRNWKADDNNLTPVSAPTFTADRGYAGNGTTSYLDTGFVPSTDGVNFQQNAGTVGIWSNTTGAQATAIDMGARISSSSRQILLQLQASTTSAARVNSDGGGKAVSPDEGGHGHLTGSRPNATDVISYRDGAPGATAAIASSARGALSVFICAINANGTPGSFSTRQYGAAYIGALSSAEILALDVALRSYMYAVGNLNGALGSFLANVSAIQIADAADSDAGKGPTNTGLARDPDLTWWVGNDGRSNSGDVTFNASIVHYSANFATVLAEITLASLGISATGMSIQGVAYDTSDGTLWAIAKDSASGGGTRILNITTAGALVSQTAVSDDHNGIAYDAARDQLWVVRDGGEITRRSKAAPQTVIGGTVTSTRTLPDHLSVSGTKLLLSAGANGSVGWVDSYDITTTTPALIEAKRPLGADAIEGAYYASGTLWVCNDAYYHGGSPALNRVLTYAWTPL